MSVLGRGGIGFINRTVGPVPLYKLSVLVMAGSYLLWLPFTGYGWLAAFAAALGLGYVVFALLMGALGFVAIMPLRGRHARTGA